MDVMSPTNDTDKQTTDFTADMGKEVCHTPPSDTDKVVVPHLPPITSEKEIRQPTNNTDKQLFPMHDGSSTTSTRSTPSHTFRVEKSNSMGLIMPRNQTLLLRSLNPTTKLDQGPAFITSEMDWVDVCAVNPPPFELYTAHVFGRPELVARLVPRGWQGLTSMKSEFELSCGGDRQKWEVVRKGLNRTYQLNGMLGHEGREFVWKGSTKTVKSLTGDEKKTKGNL
ncbi:hypothetical protein EPUS_01347 [Endocarpon pusillum Z07020]|uniref:Uncharacterized protein n=1 Tax=Endocarpon pusillum (strain Z07020 / HMAS-L-300199) TaxID=1263415 RepID=U1GVA1_ENDPU|nr:uncharacterized protein EPUS_01347 [Endocarpon pusillum Z07020]ERF75981.1 hypothetical protein EPUS_01347 [Endocarpon pusillum Z07020]